MGSLKEIIKSTYEKFPASQNSKKFLTDLLGLYSTYTQVYERFFRKLFNNSPLTPYINSDDPNSIKHTLEHILRSHTNDFLGAYFLSAVLDDILSKYSKDSKLYSSMVSFTVLSLQELAQKYHLLPGIYDDKDVVAYFAGSFLYLTSYLYKKIKGKQTNNV
ncbi:MAG: hypothetical protein ABGW69_03345 [Nanoarchaeota archaeon]